MSSSRLRKKSEKQIPRGLNFTPTSAKTALVGDPCWPARDDKTKGFTTELLKVRPFKWRCSREGICCSLKAALPVPAGYSNLESALAGRTDQVFMVQRS